MLLGGFLGGFLGSPGLLGGFMVIFCLPEIRFSLWKLAKLS
jgi:hypothetical protein